MTAVVASALPASDAPVAPARVAGRRAGDGFAAIVDAAASDADAPSANVPPVKPDEQPGQDTTANSATPTPPPADPALAAIDAAVLIAQLCPPPVVTPAMPAEPQACAPLPGQAGLPIGADAVVRARAAGEKPIRNATKNAAFTIAAEAIGSAGAPAPAIDGGVPVAATALPASASIAADGAIAASPADIGLGHHLDLAHEERWLDRLAQDIARSADGDSRLRFTLAPEHLGRLTVELAADAGGTAIRLTTESQEAHRIVTEAQPRLIAEARAQGLRVSDTQVDLDRRGGGEPQQRSDGRPGQDRARPAVIWTSPTSRVGSEAVKGVPAARDLYA